MPKRLVLKLDGLIDMACPDCFWKRRFTRHWTEFGLDIAWSRWRTEAPIINHSAIPLIESTITEINNWHLS